MIYLTPPALPGLTWRPVTSADLSLLVALAQACWMTDGGIAFLNEPDTLASRYFREGPGTGIGAFAAKGHLAACTTVRLDAGEHTHRVFIAGQVHSAWRGRGLGGYLMDWTLAQAQSLLNKTPTDSRTLQIATETLTEPARRLYQAYDFERVNEELVMRRDLGQPLPHCPLPPDVLLVSWQPDLADQFYQAYHASFRERPGFPGWSAAEWIAWTDDENHRPAWSLLARIGETPVGFVTGGLEHSDCFIMQIGVILEQRRRGLASALMVEALTRMQAAGERATELTVNINNPGAIRAYEQLGFETVGRRGRFERTLA